MRLDVFLAQELGRDENRLPALGTGCAGGSLERAIIAFDVASLAVKHDCSTPHPGMRTVEILGGIDRAHSSTLLGLHPSFEERFGMSMQENRGVVGVAGLVAAMCALGAMLAEPACSAAAHGIAAATSNSTAAATSASTGTPSATAATATPAATATAAATDPADHVEVGTLAGAPFRIDMPAKWNGVLLVYYHGYSETPVTFARDKPNRMGSGLASAGFAVVQSGYSTTGWAVEQAVPETEALREYTIEHYGQPKETYVLGHSMGGMLTIATIEKYPNRYDGALPLCGLLEPASYAFARGGALLAAFHYYYPGVLPGPIGIGASVPLDSELTKRVVAALPSDPTGHAELLALTRFKSDADLADVMVFFSYIERDLEQKIGAVVLDNHDLIYAGGADDNALNDGVHRYTAPAAALAYVKTWYTPSGLLLKPTLAVHTTYDPIIPPDTIAQYPDAVQHAASGDFFVQQYVKHDGHCNIQAEELGAALGELIRWKRSGVKPAAGAVPVPGAAGVAPSEAH